MDKGGGETAAGRMRSGKRKAKITKEKMKGEWEERKEKTGKLTFRASLFRTAASRMPLMSSTAKPTYGTRHMYTYYQSHDYHVLIPAPQTLSK